MYRLFVCYFLWNSPSPLVASQLSNYNQQSPGLKPANCASCAAFILRHQWRNLICRHAGARTRAERFVATQHIHSNPFCCKLFWNTSRFSHCQKLPPNHKMMRSSLFITILQTTTSINRHQPSIDQALWSPQFTCLNLVSRQWTDTFWDIHPSISNHQNHPPHPYLLSPQVSSLDGHCFSLRVSEDLPGRALRRLLAEQVEGKSGAALTVLKGSEKLCMNKTLKESKREGGGVGYDRVSCWGIIAYV